MCQVTKQPSNDGKDYGFNVGDKILFWSGNWLQNNSSETMKIQCTHYGRVPEVHLLKPKEVIVNKDDTDAELVILEAYNKDKT